MGEFEDKLNSILSSPEDMKKIMNLAQSLSGSGDESVKSGSPGILSGTPLEGLDPKMMSVLSGILKKMGSDRDDKKELVHALKPYLKKERSEALDRAVRYAKIARIARTVLSEMGDGGQLKL